VARASGEDDAHVIRDVRNVAFAVGWRVIHNVVKNPTLFLIPSTLFPLIQFCFVLLQSAAFTGVFTGFGIARDFEYGFARRLLLAAPRRSGIVAGYALAAAGRWA